MNEPEHLYWRCLWCDNRGFDDRELCVTCQGPVTKVYGDNEKFIKTLMRWRG